MPDLLKLRVRNFLGISAADLEIGGIVLAAGINGAGKSSLIEAAACAITASALTRGQTTKAKGANLLRDGAEKGSISLDYGGGSIRISYPECIVEQAGRPAMLGSALGIGAVKFMSLPVAERTRQIAERFNTNPTIDDVRAWAAEHPEAGLHSDKLVAALWESLDIHGWDATHGNAKKHGTKLKGRWEAVTNQAWGSTIAANWCPAPLLPGERYDLAAARAEEMRAQEAVEEMLGAVAVTTADVERLEAEGSRQACATVRTQLERARQKGRELAKQLEELVAARNRDDAPVDTSNLQGCPHCGGKIRIVYDKEEKYVFLHKAPAPLPAADMAKAQAAISAMNGKISDLKRASAENSEVTTALALAVQSAEKAGRLLIEIQSKPRIAQEQVDTARQNAADAKRRADAVQAMETATAIYQDWQHQSALIEGLAPEGIRRAVLLRKLAEINERLSELCAVARFAPVTLTDDLDCTYGDHPYVLSSESERWRVDLVLTCLLAKQEGARVILADRLDVLHAQARPGVLFLLHEVGIPALVCMTAKDQAAVPSLEKAGLGTVRWLEEGVLQ